MRVPATGGQLIVGELGPSLDGEQSGKLSLLEAKGM